MNKVTLGYLKDIKVVEPFDGPRPFHEISEEAFIKIVEKGGTTWAK